MNIFQSIRRILFSLEWIDKISPIKKNTLWSFLIKSDLNVSLKFLTPAATLTDSRSSSPLCNFAFPTNLFFSAGPRFPTSSTVRSNQSSINSSYLHQDVGLPKRSGIFAVNQLLAVKRSVDFTRFDPIMDSAGFSLFSGGEPSRSSSESFIIGIVEEFKQYTLTRDLVRNKILFFFDKTTSSASTFWLWKCSFCAMRTWRDFVDTGQEPTETVMILSVLLDRLVQKGQDDMMTTKIVSMKFFFHHNAHWWNLMCANWLVGFESNNYQNKVPNMQKETDCDSFSHQNDNKRTSDRSDEKLVARHKRTLVSPSKSVLENEELIFSLSWER